MLHQNNTFFDWLSKHFLACPSKALLGFDCPGCGLQRSVLALLQGDVVRSLQLYPATIPLTFLIIFTLLHLKFDFKFGAQLIKILFIGIASIILINYIYKIYTHNLY